MSDDRKFVLGAEAVGAFQEIDDALTANRPPHRSALVVLARAWQAWLDDERCTLDQILGLAAGKGQRPWREHLRARLRELFVMHLTAVLHADGWLVADAAKIVSAAINYATDPAFREQCERIGLRPPTEQRKRSGAEVEFWPPKSVADLYHARGGEKWSRLAGYFGDCDERRQVARLHVGDLSDPREQENRAFLTELNLAAAFRPRTAEAIKALIPDDRVERLLAK